jgi:hypothetical protein
MERRPVTDTTQRNITAPRPALLQAGADRVYDRRSLTYANSFPNPWVRGTIKTIEWMTGKLSVLRRVRQFERWVRSRDRISGTRRWGHGDRPETPQHQLDRIPVDGPVVLVANHPHGLVDGMILANLIGRRRPDYRILTRALLTGLDESAASFMIPVPFPHEPDAQSKMLEMRAAAMSHLDNNGLIALFPSGAVAASDTMFGPAIEGEWNVFTAKMIRKSGATVVPFYFTGRIPAGTRSRTRFRRCCGRAC